MKQQPDELFREKLEQLSINPSEAAWERIESNLARKNRTGWALKIAACLLPLAVVAYVIWPANKTTEELAAGMPLQTTPMELPNEPLMDTLHSVAPVDLTQTKSKKLHNRNLHYIAVNTALSLPTNSKSEHAATEQVEVVATEPTLVSSSADATLAFDTKEVQPEALTTTVVLTSTEVDQKYLIKPEVLDATLADETTSSFQKVLEKAADLKHYQQGLGTLRQAKNEILALNFRNKKRERNN
jgi:hypothetical protein